MPYIKQDERGQYVQVVRIPQTSGQLNYLITSLCNAYLMERNSDDIGYVGPTYSAINEIIGALECVKLEWYRRLASPYEDEKVLENGDLPWPTSTS